MPRRLACGELRNFVCVASWKACRKPVGRCTKIAKAIKQRGWAHGIIFLQEVGKWIGGRCVDGFVVHSGGPTESSAGGDCGFLVPRILSNNVFRERHGGYWSGIMVSNIVCISAHVLDHASEHGRAAVVSEASLEFVSECKRYHYPNNITIIVGVDANTTLPPRFLGVTGDYLLPPLKTHLLQMSRVVLAWMEALGVRCLSTFSDEPCQNQLWTCGRKRPLHKRSQIDFIAVSADVSGCAFPEDVDDDVFKFGGDHRPVYGELRIENLHTIQGARDTSLVGWTPKTSLDCDVFMTGCLAELPLCKLHDIETRAVSLAKSIEYTASSQRSYAQEPTSQVSAGAKRQRRKQRTVARLSSLSHRPTRPQYVPTQLRLEGVLTTDREEWLKQALRFGQERFSDSGNDNRIQADRLSQTISQHRSRRIDGLESNQVHFWDVLQGRAQMKPNTSSGKDSVTVEIWQKLPTTVFLHIWKLFRLRASFESDEGSPFWRMMQFVGIPKERSVTNFEGFGWIAEASTLQKWYLRTLRPQLRSEIKPSAVLSFGFKPGMATSDITSIIREFLFNGDKWGHCVYVAAQDVLTAFDTVRHDKIRSCLLARGVSLGVVAAILQELTFLEGVMQVPGAGETEYFPFTKGGRQGGVETPDIFNTTIEAALEDTVKRWGYSG